MKSLQPIVIAFFVAVAIVSLHHFGEFIGWFVLASFGFCGTQMFVRAAASEQSEQELTNQAEQMSKVETVFPEQIFSLLEVTEEVTGTDLWECKPQQDAVEIEPMPTQKEKALQEIQFQLIMQQLETLPQNKGRRKAWAVLCNRLHITGGTKLRDASLANKAKFLESQKIKILELIKAKVVALRAA